MPTSQMRREELGRLCFARIARCVALNFRASSTGPISRTNQKGTLKRSRLRRCKSALPEYNLPDTNKAASSPRSESRIQGLHPSLIKVIIVLSIYLGAGTLCFYLARHWMKGKKTNGVLDAVYFCVVTMSTVGYGDLVPDSAATKLLACAFVFTGMALIALSLSKAADYLVEKQEMLLIRALYMPKHVGMAEILKEMETNKVRYKCLMVFLLLLLIITCGTVFLAKVEKLSFVDAFYCVCSTITTLGYGDVSFSTEAGRAFAVLWILFGTISLAQFFLYVAELNTERRQKKLAKWVLGRKMTNVDLEVADLDDDGVVDVSDFIIYKLKEMGKISQEDISLVMGEFEELDIDQSGTLSATDLTLAQSQPVEEEATPP
ncbi:two-pore potassium channel 1 [Vitis vinifera]|uniref:two-pore potassium channel 1 n=1 Tax=Vitis vinifera TaxID=29760 RepID=UPI00053F6A20|nr:two-pore potassium channel 1 [Vitis vinifera]|eukprot:XP_010644564.1 PREDICTED: two-pore potassium channel 1 isoform X1 [Vitis vinifera]